MMRIATSIFFLWSFMTYGQENSVLYYHIDKTSIKYKVVKDSTANFQKYTNKAFTEFCFAGYVGIKATDTVYKNNGTHYYYSFEEQFEKIISQNIDEPARKSKRSKSYQNLSTVLNQKLTSLENSGFPFAAIKIVNSEESENTLTLDYKIDSGQFFIIDQINIKSSKKFHEKTILNLIGLQTGDTYNENEIKNIKDLLSASKLYALNRPVQVLFKANGKADIYIYIDKQKSSSADGYIGFQQDPQTSRLTLNGYLNLQLNNSFNRAEIIEMHWKSNPDKTQDFYSKLEYPFILNTPLGVGAKLALRKQDSTFLRSDIFLNLSYNHPIAKFSVFDQIESSSTLRESAPSEFRNYSKNTLGASLLLRLPNLAFAPFYHPQIFLLGGFYSYRNDTIDDNKQKISNAKYEIGYSHKIDFLKYFHLNNSITYQGLTSNIALSRNEMIYFGGLQSARGFYELELFGNETVIIRNEIEFKPVDLLSMFLLYDYSKFDYNGRHQTNSVGFGFGLNTKGTVLQIIVANGVLDQNSLDFSNTKIHLGFKSTF
ncbi:MAG: ShlB/FhaC/HecB family hemolysin secretion/activation protein [Crocinitomicaceae bacterium]